MASPLHSRTAVGLRAPRSITRLANAEGVTAHYGGPSPWGEKPDRSSAARFEATTDHARCGAIWRSWQAFHMDDRGWSDIAYSSGVCPHGDRYEGRGPGVRTAANGTTDGNNRSLAVVYIAGDDDPLTDAAKRAFLDEGTRLARIRWDHSDWKPTSCAGDSVRAWEATGWRAPAGTVAAAPEPKEWWQDMDKDTQEIITKCAERGVSRALEDEDNGGRIALLAAAREDAEQVVAEVLDGRLRTILGLRADAPLTARALIIAMQRGVSEQFTNDDSGTRAGLAEELAEHGAQTGPPSAS